MGWPCPCQQVGSHQGKAKRWSGASAVGSANTGSRAPKVLARVRPEPRSFHGYVWVGVCTQGLRVGGWGWGRCWCDDAFVGPYHFTSPFNCITTPRPPSPLSLPALPPRSPSPALHQTALQNRTLSIYDRDVYGCGVLQYACGWPDGVSFDLSTVELCLSLDPNPSSWQSSTALGCAASMGPQIALVLVSSPLRVRLLL